MPNTSLLTVEPPETGLPATGLPATGLSTIARRVVPISATIGAMPTVVRRVLRVRPMPALGWLTLVGAAALALSADAAEWQSKGAHPKHGTALKAARVEVQGEITRVSLTTSTSSAGGATNSALKWRSPGLGKSEPQYDAPQRLAPAVVRGARRVSTSADDDAPHLGNPAAESSVADPFDHWGQSVLETDRVAARPQEEGMPPLDAPSGQSETPLSPTDSQDTTSQDTTQPPARLPTQPYAESSPRLAQLPECPKPEDLKKIGEITDDITPPGSEFPPECDLGDATFEPRCWAETTYTWKASGLCHKPLYFEDVQLERYGHTCGPILQPLASGAHFFGTALILPYKMGQELPCECVYPLGYYRPGDCAPFAIQPLGLSLRGAMLQGAATTGLVFLIP